MQRLFSMTLILGFVVVLLTPLPSWSAPDEEVKEALQAVGEFIGDWKGSGGPDKVKAGPKDTIWNEQISWSWRFKDDDAWLTMNVKKGKYFKSAELRYLPAKKLYELTAVAADDSKQVFTGKVKKEVLVLERKDPDTKETQVLTMESNNEGARFIYRLARKRDGSTILNKDFMVQTTREGVTLGAKEKKNECVVSGGLGTIQVVYKGETFYVCCSGCKDAFNEKPEKYVTEFKAKKAKK